MASEAARYRDNQLVIHSLAKIAVHLGVDTGANKVLEALYRNSHDSQARFARRFQVLAYHKVSPDPHPFFQPVQPEVFEEQIAFLSRCYRVMPLLELVERSRSGDLPARAVAITFDDGYRDNYEHAFPILTKYRAPATIFVSTGAIETGQLLWHDRVFDAFRFATVQHALALRPILAKAKTLYGAERLRFVEQIEEALKPRVDKSRQDRMLTWRQIREMSTAGIEFGSHTVSHTIVSRLPREEMVKELRESKEQLFSQLRIPIESFAYPNGHIGDYNDEAQVVLKETGYRCAATSEFGLNHAFSNPFELRRGQSGHTQIELFRLAFFLHRHGVN